MMHLVKNKLKLLKLWKRIVWDNETDSKIGFSKKCFYAVKGFSEAEYLRYQFDKNNYREYISEFERLQSREINGNYKFILDNKLVFEEIFAKYTKVPTNYAWISDGNFYTLHNYSCPNEDVIAFLSSVGKSVLKWLDSGGGHGTYVIEPIGNKIFVNGTEYNNNDVLKLFSRKGNAILCEYMTQSAFSASLYPHTTNTIRIVCAKEKGSKKAAVIAAVQRIGRQCSIPVDNAHAGGLTCEIDLETGMIGYGISYFGQKEGCMTFYEKHPDTNAPIKDIRIPHWKELIQEIEELTNRFPYLNFVAWDVLLTNNGYCIIEGNASSGCGLFQMSKGIRNEALGNIYRSYGIIK